MQHPIVGYAVDALSTVRYKQSAACRVWLRVATNDQDHSHDNDAGDDDGRRKPHDGAFATSTDSVVLHTSCSVFLKRVVFRELPSVMHKAKIHPYKIARDVHSNHVEASFLTSDALRCFALATRPLNIHVALPYSIQARVYETNPIDSGFLFCLRDFSPAQGWLQRSHLNKLELQAALRLLAHWHAFFWLGANQRHSPNETLSTSFPVLKAVESVWPAGGYWHLGQQPTGQLDQLVPNWNRLVATCGFSAELDLGQRLVQVAAAMNSKCHGMDRHKPLPLHDWAESPYRTLMHGDPKAPNLFFRPADDAIAIIDFQWTGVGLGAPDIAYCIAASASPEAVPLGLSHEAVIQEYLNMYHTTFQEALVHFHADVAADARAAAAVLPRHVLQRQFEVAIVDLARVAIAEYWATITPEVFAARSGNISFNKSRHVAQWLVETTHAYLQRMEHGTSAASLILRPASDGGNVQVHM